MLTGSPSGANTKHREYVMQASHLEIDHIQSVHPLSGTYLLYTLKIFGFTIILHNGFVHFLVFFWGLNRFIIMCCCMCQCADLSGRDWGV